MDCDSNRCLFVWSGKWCVVKVNIGELLVAQDAGDEAANALDRNIIIRNIEIYEKRTRVQMLNERGNMLHLQVIT